MDARGALFEGSLYYSYGQLWVFDREIRTAACEWTEAHVRQGFARKEDSVAFSTLDEFGSAEITVSLGRFAYSEAVVRAIEVPFFVRSERVYVGGPEDVSHDAGRILTLARGHYALTASQRFECADQDALAIALFFERLDEPRTRSTILVADDGLAQRPEPLIEEATRLEIAERS